MRALLRAGHLQPAAAVTLIAAALAASVGRSPLSVGGLALAVGAGQLAVGWSNDYLDRGRDAEAGRLDKPVAAGQVAPARVAVGAVVALAACVPLSLLSGWQAGLLHLAAVAAALAYNAGLKATVWSPAPYLFAFGCLPAVVTLGSAGRPWPPWWAMLAAGLLGCGAHLVNALPDIDADRQAGVLGAPQRLGPAWSLRLGAALLAAAVSLLAVAPAGRRAWAAAALVAAAGAFAVAVVVVARRRPRDAWSLTIAGALAAVALLVASGQSLV